MKTLIKNGTVVNAHESIRADVLIEGERIIAVGEGLKCDGADIIDAADCLVMPGFIDTHTHFDLDLGYTRTADDFLAGTRAALLGGTTTVLDFATQDKGNTLKAAYDMWMDKAKGSSCNYGFHMAMVEWNENIEAELALMRELGVTSYKMYMAYDALRVDDGAIYSALKAISRHGGLLGVHCENFDVLKRRITELQAQGITGPEGHPLSRPSPIEAEAVARFLRIAELALAPCYVVHLSTEEGLIEALRARARGQTVYLETCMQYLLLDDSRYLERDAAKYVMSPPLRKTSDNKALFNALAAGDIDFVGTDHCSFTMAQKARGANNFADIPNGGASVQHRPVLLFTYGVCAGILSAQRMVDCLAAAPARLFGIKERGTIAEGNIADIVIWDTRVTGRITDTNHAHNCDNSPFAGFDTIGGAREVLLNGEHVVSDFEMIKPGMGKYVARSPCHHATLRVAR